MKLIFGYLLAVLVTYVLGAIFVSQANIAAVTAMGFEITPVQRVDSLIHDIGNMYDIYLILIAVALVIALPFAALITRSSPHLRLIGYASAGFVALISIHVILKAVLGVSGIAPTRDIMGLIAQGAAGAVGGLVFHLMVRIPMQKDES